MISSVVVGIVTEFDAITGLGIIQVQGEELCFHAMDITDKTRSINVSEVVAGTLSIGAGLQKELIQVVKI